MRLGGPTIPQKYQERLGAEILRGPSRPSFARTTQRSPTATAERTWAWRPFSQLHKKYWRKDRTRQRVSCCNLTRQPAQAWQNELCRFDGRQMWYFINRRWVREQGYPTRGYRKNLGLAVRGVADVDVPLVQRANLNVKRAACRSKTKSRPGRSRRHVEQAYIGATLQEAAAGSYSPPSTSSVHAG